VILSHISRLLKREQDTLMGSVKKKKKIPPNWKLRRADEDESNSISRRVKINSVCLESAARSSGQVGLWNSNLKMSHHS
jgi:hypothetical protein